MAATEKPHRYKLIAKIAIILCAVSWFCPSQALTPGFLTIKNGYFYDPGMEEYW